jgi:hypothetical protein
MNMKAVVPFIHHSSFIIPRYKNAQPGGSSALEGCARRCLKV